MLLDKDERNRSSFFEGSQFPQLQELQKKWTIVAEDAQAALERLGFLRFRFPTIYDVEKSGIVGRRGMFYFHILGARVERNRRLAPRTAELLDRLPGLATAAFYVLGPGAHILPHTGVSQDLMLRAHLGLICPPDCYLRIGREQQSWKEGEWMVFDDTLEHEAWNGSDRTRCVLSLDFMPDPPYDAEQRLRSLRHSMLGSKMGESPWYLAGGLAEEPEFLEKMKEAASTVKPGRARLIENVVQSQGLFFT